MSLSIAKRFMKQFDAQQDLGVKLKKVKKPKQKVPVQSKEAKIQKLLLLNSTLDDELCKNLLRNATKTKRPSSMLKKQNETNQELKESEAIFSEQDFKNFEEDYKQIHLNDEN